MTHSPEGVCPEATRPAGLPWWVWFYDFWGKIRRFFLVRYRKQYVGNQLALRRGECRRCAGCCAIAFKCPHLSGHSCAIYETRYRQCRAFPIDERDLRYRHCGFHFATPEASGAEARAKDAR